jgi:alginate O-acetyltransferase complex protein AlgJ
LFVRRGPVLPHLPIRLRLSKLGRQQRRLAKQQAASLVDGGRLLRDGKFVQGRDGWLFMAHDRNEVMPQHTGERRLSPEDLAQWCVLLERRVAGLAERGSRFTMMVAPDTHSVYQEKLPEGIRLAPDRPVHQLMRELERAAVPVSIIYPLEQMLASKGARAVCSPIDSHWTDFGAHVAYTAILDELSEIVPVRRLAADEVVFQDMIGSGDLGVKADPTRFCVSPVGIVRYPAARLLFDNCVENVGSVLLTECRAAPVTTCLLLGDSYAYSIVKFLAESFGRLVLAHSPGLDWGLVDQIKPDVVVGLMAERFLIEVPEDGADLAATELRKRAARRTRPPQTHWFGKRSSSPIDAERLRAHFISAGDERAATIVSLLAYGGLVAQEITALRWADVGERELTIRRRGVRIGEGPPVRCVPMIEPLAEDLRRWKGLQERCTPRSLLFPDHRNLEWAAGEWSTWRVEVFDPAVAACGLDLELPLDLRDVIITLLIHQHVPAKEIARRVGEKTREVKHLYRRLLQITGNWEPVDAAGLVRSARRAIAAREQPAALGSRTPARLAAPQAPG